MNYPDGVNRLPDDEIYTCDNCGVKSDHDGYDECPECNDQNMCSSCLMCHSCSTQFDTCECGSGELVAMLEDCCKECYDEEDEDE